MGIPVLDPGADAGFARHAIRCGSFGSVRELTAAIRLFTDGWNDRGQPFTWTKAAGEILAHAMHEETS